MLCLTIRTNNQLGLVMVYGGTDPDTEDKLQCTKLAGSCEPCLTLQHRLPHQLAGDMCLNLNTDCIYDIKMSVLFRKYTLRTGNSVV